MYFTPSLWLEKVNEDGSKMVQYPGILLIGGTERGFHLLSKLLEEGERITAMFVLKEDEHEQAQYCERIVDLCTRLAIPCFPRKRLTSEDIRIIEAIAKPDIIFVCGWRTILSNSVLNQAPLGAYAAHDSLLPRYRGFAPTNWAIINGECETGVTLFQMTDAVDAGPVFGYRHIKIGPNDSASTIYMMVVKESVDLYLDLLKHVRENEVRAVDQDHKQATYTCSRIPSDGLIDWQWSTERIYNMVRGLSKPYPGAYTYWRSQKCFIWKAQPVANPPTYVGRLPGRVIGIRSGKGVEVLTGDGILLVEEVQLEGRDPMRGDTLVRSVRANFGIDIGKEIEQLQRRIQMLEETVQNLQANTVNRPGGH